MTRATLGRSRLHGLGLTRNQLDRASDRETPANTASGRSEAWLSRLSGGQEIAGSNPVGPKFRIGLAALTGRGAFLTLEVSACSFLILP